MLYTYFSYYYVVVQRHVMTEFFCHKSMCMYMCVYACCMPSYACTCVCVFIAVILFKSMFTHSLLCTSFCLIFVYIYIYICAGGSPISFGDLFRCIASVMLLLQAVWICHFPTWRERVCWWPWRMWPCRLAGMGEIQFVWFVLCLMLITVTNYCMLISSV